MAEEIYIAPTGGLNTDDSPLSGSAENPNVSDYQQGDYRYALNARISASSQGNSGGLENIPSTLLINNYYTWNGSSFVSGSPQSGTNTAINKYEDRQNGLVFWFVKNSNGHHAILQYNRVTQQIWELLQWDGLLFSNWISCTKIDKYLLFTDGNTTLGTGNPPRIIDVTSIYTLKYTLGSNFSEYHISLSKWAPVAPPIINVTGQAAGNVFIKVGIYQFAYRYIYIGGFRSTWSPASNFVSNELLGYVNTPSSNPLQGPFTNFGVNTNGFIFDYTTPANTAFPHSDSRFYTFVDTIEYAYRDSANASWRVFSRVQLNGSAPATDITFANSGALYNVADSDIGQPYDAVPLLSQTVEAIDNRPMLGNNLDDLAPMSNFAVTNVQVYSVSYTNARNDWFNYSGGALPDKTAQWFSFKENGIYKLGIIFKHYDGRSGLVQTLDYWTYNIPVNLAQNPCAQEDLHALGFKIAAGLQPPVWAVDYQIVRTNCLNIDMFIIGQVADIIFLTAGPTTDLSTGLNASVQSAFSDYYNNYNTGGSQYPLISRIINAISTNAAVSSPLSASLIYFDIKNFTISSNIGFGISSSSNSVYYNWQQGDRIRFYASTTSNFSGPYVQFDQLILYYSGTGIAVAIPDNFSSYYMGSRTTVKASATPSASKLFSIEIYRPKKYSKDNDVVYYEMGEWYPVLQPGTGSRAFSKTDFTWSGTGSVTTSTVNGFNYYNTYPIINGDVWLVVKNFYYPFAGGGNNTVFSGYLGGFQTGGFNIITDYPLFPQMNQDRNNAAGIWEHNVGKPLSAYKYNAVQLNKYNQVRFGGKFLEDSIFIGINNFRDENQFLYPSEYGKIRAMVNTSNTQVKNVGNILLVIGEEEAWSVYVNRTTLEDLSGNTQVSLSDKVLGAYNTLLGSFGTLNPESVSKRNSRVIYWNNKKGTWVRYSEDGLTPISKYKMGTWFKNLGIIMSPSFAAGNTPATALSVYDNYYDEWITLFSSSYLPGTYQGYSSYKSATFSELPMEHGGKRWKSFFDYSTDIFAALENEVYSIIGTNVHIHYGGTDFNSFYGSKKDTYWQPIANPEIRRKKIWKNVQVGAQDNWSFPTITGDPVSNGGTQQQTSLLLANMNQIEGDYWSDIYRDQNTPNVSNAIVEGQPMRSKSLSLLMKLDPSVTWYSFLSWLMVYYDISEKTAKK